jgi:hypothetical protein
MARFAKFPLAAGLLMREGSMARVLVQGVVRRLARRSRQSDEIEGVLVEIEAQTLVFVPLEEGTPVPDVGEVFTAWTTLHHLRQALDCGNKKRTT